MNFQVFVRAGLETCLWGEIRFWTPDPSREMLSWMSQVQQLQIRYDPAEDRALFTVTTSHHQAFRMWLTRRYTAALWPILLRFAESEPLARRVAEPEARHAVLSFQREKAIAETDFKTPFREDAAELPFGDTPLVLTHAELRRQPDGSSALWFGAQDKRGLQLRPSIKLVHSLIKLISDVATKADWQLELEPGWAHPQAIEPPETLQ